MNPDNVRYLPMWKQGATAEERFLELAQIARQHPERFSRLFVVYQEELPDKSTITRYVSLGGCATEILGLIELGKFELLKWINSL